MFTSATADNKSRRQTQKLAGMLLVFLLTSFVAIPDAEAACPNVAFGALGNLVELVSCTETQQSSDVTNINLVVPASVANGDLLIAVVAKDDDEVVNTPAGWAIVNQRIIGNNDGYLSVFYRVSNGAEPANYNISWTSGEEAYAYMMRFTGASGQILSATNWGNTGTAQAPSINTLVQDSLIVRIVGWDDDDEANDPGTIVAGHTNITQDQSGGGGGTVSGGAAYVNQTGLGATGTANFANGNEQWATMTLGIEPIEFRFSMPDLDSSVCGIQQVTLSVTDRLGTPMSWFAGEVTLSATNSTNATWSDGPGLTNSVVDLTGGNATYQFSTGDGGTAVFEYYNPDAGVVDFGVTYGIFSERANYGVYTGPILTVNPCEFRISYGSDPANEMGTCGIETLTIDMVDAVTGDAATNYSGTITINNNRLTSGNYAANTVPGAFSNGGLNDGVATFAFGIGDSQAVLDYTDTSLGSNINFTVSAVTSSGTPILDSTNATFDPDLDILACEFRIVHPVGNTDFLGDTCTPHSLTIEVRDPAGALVDYAGTVTISSDALAGTWSVASATNGLTDNGSGEIEYTFAGASDGGDIVLNYSLETVNAAVNFNVVENVSTGIQPPSAPWDASLDVAGCTIDIQVAPTMGVCSAGETISIRILDRGGLVATGYDGQIQINTDSIYGDYVLPAGGLGGNGTLDDGAMADDGIATYDFNVALGDAGRVDINFVTATPETIQFSASALTGPPLVIDVGSARDLEILGCEIVISYVDDATSDVCSRTAINIAVRAGAALVSGFDGIVTISNDITSGSWSINDVAVPGNITDTLPNDGEIVYDFDPLDGGDIVLDFERAIPAAAIDFSATTTTPSVTAASGEPTLEIITCTARVSMPALDQDMNVCSPFKTIIVSIFNRDGGLANGTIGSVTLTADSTKGDFIGTDGVALNLANGGPNDGIASYTFDGSEGGDATFDYSTSTIGSLDFGISSPYISFVSDGNETLNVLDCEFRISFDGGASGADGASDVCSLQAMTIEVWNVNGGSSAVVSDYIGTVNINTSSGSWFEQGGGSPGMLTDGFAQDGSATYEFVGGDSGAVTLDFATDSSGTLNFSVTQGAISADNVAWDPDLVIALCTFRITLVDGTMSACTTEDVTITAYNSNDVIASTYTGTVSISTSTLHGNWTGTGVTDTPGDDNGVATVDITAGGTVTITFEDFNFEDVNVNLVAGEIVEDGAFDPDLEVTGCLPSIVSSICFPGSGGGLGSLPLSASPGPGRMVVMWVFHAADPSPQTVTGATFNSVGMTEFGQVNAANTGVSMWGILDANLPAGGSSYAGAYTFDAAPANTASMCMAEITDVEQTFAGLVVGTNTFGATGDLTTSITTTANNALILSGAITDRDPGGNTWFNSVNPDPPLTMRFTGNNDQNPVGGTGGGSEGIKPVAGLISVNDVDAQNPPTSAAHIVVSLNPLVAGNPEADGYVPVLLHETLSGNISYRAIGSTLRTHSNAATTPNTNGECSFVPVGTGTTADLNLPTGSTVERAYLYWAGSGTQAQSDLDIEFGHSTELVGGLNSITGEELFMINGVGNAGNLDYFASYKDVTSEVAATGNGTYTFRELGVQTGTPWGGGATACAGGWGLVVVYSNPNEAFRVANLFHGFQPFQNSAFTLVPRNFRMKTTDDDPLLFDPNGQITHITVEGDETLTGGAAPGEALGIQAGPGDNNFNILTNSYNPPEGDFNSTVTRPSYFLDNGPGGTGLYQFNATGGDDGAGYENDAEIPNHPDLLPYSPSDVREQGDSWGFDVDTHYISGNDDTGELWFFAQPNAEAEQITTQYSSGQDLVLLISEVISVTNFDLADLEVFKSLSGPLKVNQAQDYVITVTNNGNNGISGGEATGLVVVADILPNGMTLNSVSGTDWTCYTGADRYSCTFDILNDCVDYGTGTDNIGCETAVNELSTGESLPPLTANVQVGGFAFFPDESNPTKNVARLQHNGANSLPVDAACIALISGNPGVAPDPSSCRRSPQFDNRNDLDGGAIDINDIDDKDGENNNVDSIVANVIGLKTDLAIDKLIDGDLEVGEVQTYTITVTNNGPDATDETITVIDNAPAGIVFNSAASGTGWVCGTNNATQISCTYAASLPALSSATLTLPVTVNGAAGVSVTNTAQVTPGIHNFDTTNTANNTDSDTSVIIAPPVASQEEFLISVSVLGNATTIGGLDPFQNDDYINYNPQTDVGTGFYDDSATGDVRDANAVHVFKNGHIAISAKGPATSTVGSLAFQPEDIVVYDPILDTATMLFDGSAIFKGPIGTQHNIDAVFVKEDGKIVFSVFGDGNPLTNDDVCIRQPDLLLGGGPDVCFSEADVVQYDPSDDSVTILIDGYDSTDGDDEIFTSEAQVNGIYIRVDDTDPNAVKEVYILSVNGTVQVGACASCDPVPGTGITPDDIIEVDLTGANPVTQNLFVGDVPFGIFAPSDNAREIDAIHVKEDGYHGHFSISQSQAGTTCAAGQITIRKHEFNHDVDTNYAGSIEITTTDGLAGVGTWSIADGDGALTNVGVDDGTATYTFVPSDMGEVTLYLTETDASTIDVNVTNRLVEEQEDPAFIFSNVISDISYLDEFTAAAFDNNDGLTVWKNPWQEVDDAAADTGVSNGNVLIAAGSMQFTTESGNTSAEMSREADLSLVFPISNDLVTLSFDYKYSALNAGADRFVAEVRESAGAAWEEVWAFNLGGSNGTFQGSGAIDLKAAIELSRAFTAWSATTEIRFRVDTGYTGTSRMFIDNVLLETGTTKCGIGVMDHYEIRIDNITGDANTLVPGISCLATQITISGHDSNHVSATPNESVTFRALSETLVNKGTWSAPFVGTGPFVESGTSVDGLATYTFPASESQVVLNFNYTDPTLDPEKVNFNITSPYGVDANEDPTLQVGDVVLRLFNETQNGVNLIPTQISGKSSNVAAPTADTLTVQLITTDLTDTTQCMPLVDVGETLTFSFALECIDANTCNSGSLVTPVTTVDNIIDGPATPVEIPNLDSNAGNGASAYADVDLTFGNFANSGIAAEIVLMYQDAGNVQLHAQLDPLINVNANNAALMLTPGAAVGTPFQASSNVFTVRPFGLDIDFPTGVLGSEGRDTNGIGDASYAVDAQGTKFAVAGVGFNTRVRGIQYDPLDDPNADGIPETDSILWDNLSTPNFGNDSTAATYKVQVNSTTIAPAGGYGVLSDNEFLTFTNGAQTHTMTFDEVGVIDLEASLLKTSDDTSANYLLSGVQLTGHVRDVGRFYPASFELSGGSIVSRVEASMESMCINPISDFTYMGEEFQINAMLEAQNALGDRTRNYVGAALSVDDYAKLDINNLAANNFFIFEELAGVDTDLSARRALGSTAPDVSWPTDAAAEASRGIGMLTGNLRLNRQVSDEEDGPFADLSIGLNTSDSDGAALELGIDIDEVVPIANDVALIATESFRYGRMTIGNAFGPETEELGVPFRIEYWTGTEWATNDLDNCTVFTYDATQADPLQRSVFYVEGTWTGDLDADADSNGDGETTVEIDAVSPPNSDPAFDVTLSFSGGQTGDISGVDNESVPDGRNDDRPLFTSAPGLVGSALIEFDLDHPSLPYSLGFLSYDWAVSNNQEDDDGDAFDEVFTPEDGDYSKNPRGQINFGSYRGHDRVINWQEIYIGPTP